MIEAESRQNAGSRAQQVGVTAGFCLVAAIAYLSRNCLGVFVADPSFQAELGATEKELGVVMSAFFFSYAFFQIPAGWLGQRFGTRTVLTVSDWLPAHRRAISCGFMAACMSIGGAVASGLTGKLAGGGMSWQTIVMLYSIPGIVWGVSFGFLFRDRPQPQTTERENSSSNDGPSESPKIDWHRLLTSRVLWFVNGQQFFRAAGYIFYATWFPKYLREVHHVSLPGAGLLASLPLIAVVAGSSLGGILNDVLLERTGSRTIARKYVAVICLTACGLLTLSAMWMQSISAAMTLITCSSFLAAIAGPCSYAQTIDLAGKDVPVVFGIMNMAGNFGAALCPIAVSHLTDFLGSWELLLIFFCGIYLAAALCWVFLDAEATIDG